jgi:hypothetical protein
MNRVFKLFLLGVVITFGSTPTLTLGDPENCPCDIYWQAALDATSCTSEIHLFNGMLRRDEVAAQGTILWWSAPDTVPPHPLICAKSRTFKTACDLIVGVPEGTRCVESFVAGREFFPKNKFFGICKESMRHMLLELNSRPSCD